nr:PREDICTED: microtubule-actin cross-linking factor 1 [Latimeria chalumnae]|eukprot:XP_014343669.1 PREDICTED: microtubule-actin cross-linking factor 1 [Latimeria chalumnae]
MAGFIPGLLPASLSQEKEFVQAYEDVLERYKDERDRVQKKTFTKWVNKHLIKVRKHINDLYEDLRDGHNLISLLEVLSGVKLPREKGRMRFHRLQNVQIALDFLKQRQVKLVNIRNDDITDGNPKLTLGLIWTIILHFQISDIYVSGESGDMSAKEKLLLWTQKVTEGYPGIRCTNFTSCWSDGRMFNALIHRYRPDLIDMEQVARQSNRENLEQAFEVAEVLGVTRLLDAEDVDVPSPDEKSVITYVSSIYDVFPKVPEGGDGISANDIEFKWQEYQNRVDFLLQWVRQHTILMSEKSFPQNPVELKALYNEYVHFKETEITAKEEEKGKIEHLYKLLEVWIEFGRVKLPQGYHPNDLEEEWGKLIIEMLEREKALRPAVERLELLLQIANKIQNGALSCEEKLTLARNTLQADASQLELGQPLQYESDVVMYLQECEGLIRQLQVDLKILRDEKYYQVEQLVFRIVQLQDELVTLRLECGNLYRKGQFTASELLRPPNMTTTDFCIDRGSNMLHTTSAVWFRKPMTRAELVAISSSEDEGYLRFVYELLAWVEETQIKLERAEWGSDLPSVETQLEIHQVIHSAVEEQEASLRDLKFYESKISPNFRSSYSETLGKLENQFYKLLETSSLRLRHLKSLHGFVSRATTELIWLNEKEEEELAFDWSDNNPNMPAKRDSFIDLTGELEEKHNVIKSLQETAEFLSLENHPAKQTVEAYSAAVQSQWQWVKQLCGCVEQHVRENTAYFQFFGDARDSETYLRNLQEAIKRKYTCDRGIVLLRLEDLLQDSMDEKEQLIQYKSSVASLVGRAKTIVQLKARNPDTTLKGTIPIRAVCDYRQIEITIGKNDECVLEDNSQRTKWKVISPTGNEAMVPSVCFVIPPPNKEATETASRIEQLYQNVMSLWHQLHVNMKSVVSWKYLVKDIENVQGWNKQMIKSLSGSERQHTLKSLQGHYEDFLEDSQESQVFSLSDRLQLEQEVDACKEHAKSLVESMETEEKDESLTKSYISELQNIRLRLEDCEQRLVRCVQPPTTKDEALQDSAICIAEQERLQEELEGLKSNLGEISDKCESFFYRSPASTGVPNLRSELNLAVQKMDRVYALSSVYLDRLKTVDVVLRNTQGAEAVVQAYEVKLSQENPVSADLQAIQAERETLQQWLSNVNEKESVFTDLEDEILKAGEVAERLYRLNNERNHDLERYQEKAVQLRDRWQNVHTQIETRQSELEGIQDLLQCYRESHDSLVQWIEEMTTQQELMQAGQGEDSKVLSEQLSQQMALVAEIEKNQAKLDECQKYSQQYSTSVKDYELQLMTYRAFVESQQKSPVKRRRLPSSSDVITQEFMDLRTRYTALVTLMTQQVKYISDALRRLEEEEKVVEEEKHEHMGKVTELLGWVAGIGKSLQEKVVQLDGAELEDIERSFSEQQALTGELSAKKDEIAEAVQSAQLFLAKHGNKLSEEERAELTDQLTSLKKRHNQLCSQSTEQLQNLKKKLEHEEEQKGNKAIAGVIDLGTVEIFPVFQAMQNGLIDQDTGVALLEAQVTMSGLIVPETSETLSLDEALERNLIDRTTAQSLHELQTALEVIDQTTFKNKRLLPAVAAIEEGKIGEDMGLKILETHLATGGLPAPPKSERMSLEKALKEDRITAQVYSKLKTYQKSYKNLIDPNTAEKLNLSDLMQRCIINRETGLKLLPVKQLAGGMVGLKSGRKVSIFRAVQEGLIDRQVTVRLLEAQLFAGGIVDPRTGHRLTVDEAVRHGLIDQDMACALLIRQLQMSGIIDTVTGQRLSIDEAVNRDLVASRIALVILESLWSFMGLLWPESGEILSVADALQQGIVSSELAHKILQHRQQIRALYIPETTEILSWENAVRHRVLNKDVAEILSSTLIPDVMPSMKLADSPTLNRLSWNSAQGSPPCYEDKSFEKDSLTSQSDAAQRLMFHLMTHSYVNVHDGQRLLLVNAELNDITKDCIEAKVNAKDLEDGKEKSEEMSVEVVTLAEKPSFLKAAGGEMSLRSLKSQFVYVDEKTKEIEPVHVRVDYSENVQQSDGAYRITRKGTERIENPPLAVDDKTMTAMDQKMDLCDEDKTIKALMKAPKRSLDAEYNDQKEDLDHYTILASNSSISEDTSERKPSKTQISVEVIKPAEDVVDLVAQFHSVVMAVNVDGVSGSLSQANTTQTVEETVKESSKEGRKKKGRKSKIGKAIPVLELNQNLPELGVKETTDDIMGMYISDEKVRNVKVTTEQENANGMQEFITEKPDGVKRKFGQSGGNAHSDKSIVALSLCSKFKPSLEEENMLDVLTAQLLEGGILDNLTGKKLLLNEAMAKGILQSHTAVKVMDKLGMFSGFFDSHTCEMLNTDDVIDEGLMDEKLVQKIFKSDCTISGVLDSSRNVICPVQNAADLGLLDRETAKRLLEGQLVNGGIIDLKRGKKVSVTLASRLGLVDSATQEELIKLEKASKGKGTDETTKHKIIELQSETSGIVDPRTKESLNIAQSLERGLLETKQAFQVLVKQVADGGIIHSLSGMRLCVADAFNHGLIDQEMAEELEDVETACQHQYIHPETKEPVTLLQAASVGLVDPEFAVQMQEVQALSGSFKDPTTGQKLTLTKAVKQGLLEKQVLDKILGNTEMQHRIVDPEIAMIVSYSDLVKRGMIDVHSGQRYLEVKPFTGLKNEVTGETIPIAEAAKAGEVDLVPVLRLLQAQADTGGLFDVNVSKRLSIMAAVNQGLIDEDMAKIIVTNQLVAGGVVDPSNGERVTLKEAVERGLLSFKMAADIQVSHPLTIEEYINKILNQEETEWGSPEVTQNGTSMKREMATCKLDSSIDNESSNSKLENMDYIISGEAQSTNTEQEKINSIREGENEGTSQSEDVLCYSLENVDPSLVPTPFQGKFFHKLTKEKTMKGKKEETMFEVESPPTSTLENEIKMSQMQDTFVYEISKKESETLTSKEEGVKVKPKSKKSKTRMKPKDIISKRPAEERSGFRVKVVTSKVPETFGNETRMSDFTTSQNTQHSDSCKMSQVPVDSLVLDSETDVEMKSEELPFTASNQQIDMSIFFVKDVLEKGIKDEFYKDVSEPKLKRMQEQLSLEMLQEGVEQEGEFDTYYAPLEKVVQHLRDDSIDLQEAAKVKNIEEWHEQESQQDAGEEFQNVQHSQGSQQDVGKEFQNVQHEQESQQETGKEAQNVNYEQESQQEADNKSHVEQHEELFQQDVGKRVQEGSYQEAGKKVQNEQDKEQSQQEAGKENQDGGKEVQSIQHKQESQEEAVEEQENPVKYSFSKKQCLEQDEKLVAYLSFVLDIEVRLKQLQPVGTNLSALQEQLRQAEALDSELSNLSEHLSKELESVNEMLAGNTRDVPKQLLKALRKDCKNLQKSYTSVCDVSRSRLLTLRNQVESEKDKIKAEHEKLQNQLQDLLNWVSETRSALQDLDAKEKDDAVNLKQCVKGYKELKDPLSNAKSQLDSSAFAIQFFISEHAQDLTPQQSRQLLRLLNELQRSFRELSESVAARSEVLRVKLQEEEKAQHQKVLREQQAESRQKLDELATWLAQAERVVTGPQATVANADLSALQKRQNDIRDLQREMDLRAASIADVIKATEEFLEENRGKLSPEELAVIENKLQKAKEQYRALQRSAETAQKETETAMTTVVQQESEKAKAAEELEENRTRITGLLGWINSLSETGPLELQGVGPDQNLQAEFTSGLRNGFHEVSDGQDEMKKMAAENVTGLNQQYQVLKARHQALLSQQQEFILATQSAQAFLDKYGSTLSPEEREQLRSNLEDLRTQFETSLAQSETELRQVQALQEELCKFLKDYGEFESWMVQSELDLEDMKRGESDPHSLRTKLHRQSALSEDVISHKGDLRYITISGQKVLDAARVMSEKKAGKESTAGLDPSGTSSLVKSKLDDATNRYNELHSKCNNLGSQMNSLLDRYQAFQGVADTLSSWIDGSEEAAKKLLLENIASDPQNVQAQLESTKVLQGDVAEHQVQVETLKKTAAALLDTEGDLTVDRDCVRQTTDSLAARFEDLNRKMSERVEKLQMAVAQTQSVQEGLESLLQWVDGVEKNLSKQTSIPPSAAAVQDMLGKSMKLRHDLASRKSSLDKIREMTQGLVETADAKTASVLQGQLSDLTGRVGAASRDQRDKEEVLKGLLPKLELHEKLTQELLQFTESKAKTLAAGNQPDNDIGHFSMQLKDLNSELSKQRGVLHSVEQLTQELTACSLLSDTAQLEGTVQRLSRDFTELGEVVKGREEEAFSCQQQLSEFRALVGSLRAWLKGSEAEMPAVENSLSSEELDRRIQKVQVLSEDWAAERAKVQEVNSKGSELENLIIELTAPDTKTGTVLSSGGGSSPSVNGYHTCKDLTEIQCDVSDVNHGYESFGAALRDREEQLSAMLDQMRMAQREASSILSWLESKEQTLSMLGASPTKPEAVREQAQQNKAVLAELEQNSEKVEQLKKTLLDLLEKHPDSPEVEMWKKMLAEINSKWTRASQMTAERQQQLEDSANQLTSFQTTAAQLSPWLMEKELMMSVLGPLSIDPNMLNAQKQQVQFMLKEFGTRRSQYEQLGQAAERMLTSSGDVTPPCSHVQDQLQTINEKWDQLTERLNSRSGQIDQAIVKSTQYQDLLQNLTERTKTIGQKLNSQSAISTQPEAVKQQLEETSEIRSELEEQKELISEAQALCEELAALIGEQYLKDELKKRLEAVILPFQGLEDTAGERMNRLQTALASSQQFQQMFDELRSWLDDKCKKHSRSPPISAKLETLQSQTHEQEEFQKSLNQHTGSYEMIVDEGEALLVTVQPGEEKTALQNQLTTLKAHWDELSKQTADRHSKLKDCMQKAQKYKQHVEELLPWIENCEAKVDELEVTIDSSQLEASLLEAKSLQHDAEKRRSLLEMLNSAADILIDASQLDEDDIRDEKAGINQRMDTITEQLQAKTDSIEEMSQRLREFQENLKNIEKKLEGAKQQLDIYEVLGPQACSNRNLDKLRAQQETLQALESQVYYLKNLTQGLVQDAPEGSDSSKLLQKLEFVQQEFGTVKQKVSECCSSMEGKIQGISQLQSHVREMFSQLADLDDELDSMSPVGRDMDSLQSQAEDVRTFFGKLQQLKTDIEASEKECKQMLEVEGSPEIQMLKRELEALNKQSTKLGERGRNRQEQLETTMSRVEEFYDKLKELNCLLTLAEEGDASQGVVGTEVDTINQQLADFKTFQKVQVDPIQPKLQQVNGLGQGLIQSASKNADVQGLEHDLEETNTRWNTLNKKVAERITHLQEALLHCGKFQDALEPLLSWLMDTEDLIANQKPPSAEYKVVKAQIQEQKLLQRLLDDRKATVEIIRAEGGRIAQSAEPADQEKICKQLQSLSERWDALLGKAAARQNQLEDILVLAKQFHEAIEPLTDWLTVTEKKLANSEPIGTQTTKIQQQITRHKALEEDIEKHSVGVEQAVSMGQSLELLSSTSDQAALAERLDSTQTWYEELRDRCGRKAALLQQALDNARIFGEDEVEVLNWLMEVQDKLSRVSVKDYKQDVLHKQHTEQLALNEEIVNRRRNVDQAVKNGQALLKQTTGEEVIVIQEKLDSIKTRYSEITSISSKALKTLEQALQLATKFQSTHQELCSWLSSVEAELTSNGSQSPAGEQIPQFQKRQKELKKEIMEHRLVLDTVNEVSSALLELVPWRAREGLDRLVSEANERYKSINDIVAQRVEQIDAAIQRSQQYEQAADAELAWVAETKRKLTALGPIRLEQDQTTAQLQVQKAFSIDIIRHKDTVDELLATREEILGTCGEEQKAILQEKTDSLVEHYEEVSHLNSERYVRLERAQALVSQFWETYEELSPWIEETRVLILQLPAPAIDHDLLKQQQEDMRNLRELIAEHKPQIDKLVKIGPQLEELNTEEGMMVREKYTTAGALYAQIKDEVRQRAIALDEAVAQSAQNAEFHDKIEPMLENLGHIVDRLRMAPSIPAEVDKIKEFIGDNKSVAMEQEKLQPSFEAMKRRGEELISRSQGIDKDPAAKGIQDKLDQMVFFWEDIKARVEEREIKLLDVLDLAVKFWYDMAALLTTIKDTQDIVRDLENPGIDPSIIKQQIEAAESMKEEMDTLHEELEFLRILGADVIFACGETEKPEVKKSIDEMNSAWENLKKTWKERMDKLEEAMQAAVQYQDALQGMFDWLDNAVIKLCDMSSIGTDISTVKQQLDEMKEFKMEVYQQQIEMEKLSHQGELLLKKASDETDQDLIQEPLTELRHLWENLGDKINHRQHKLEAALLALGQFQHALAELMAWLTHTEELLDAQRPVGSDPKVIEIELAKHHVLKNDVLAHQSTVGTVNKAGQELVESSSGDDAQSLQSRLDKLNQCWKSVLQKTEERLQQLEMTLQQAQGFHGEIEDFLHWMIRMESQLSASKAMGGLPETAREQLNTHLELYKGFMANEETYRSLLEKGKMMLLNRDDSSGSNTEQSVGLLEQKWQSLSTKMEERKAKLEDALNLATEFQNSLQDFINWLTQAEQNLNIAPPPSLILDTVLFQIDEHKVFANEVNSHREQIIELDKTGNQLKYMSQKQDVVLIKNLLVSMQSRWEKVVQRSVERGRALDDARKRAKQFHEAWKKLVDWLEEAENQLDSELEISKDPDKIKVQLTKHKEFQKTLGGKQPVYDTTIRTGRAMKDKASLSDDIQKLDHLLGEVRDKWDTVCGKSVERQHKLEEALLFSGQFTDAMQALVDWLYKVEPQLAEDQPVHGDLDLVMNLMDAHKVFQKELGKRTSSVQALKRSARDLIENSRDDTTWVKGQLQELSTRWDTVCKLSVSKQSRLEQALKQAEDFRTAIHMLLEWLSEAEQTLRFRGALPDDTEALQSLIDLHKEFMQKVEEKQVDVNKTAAMGEAILAVSHPDCFTTIKHWITIIRARFEEVLTWARQHQQRLATALAELVTNAELLEELLAWIQWAETTLIQRDQEPMPQNIEQVKDLISEHQSFMEEMTRKQPDVDKVTKTYKRKASESSHVPLMEKTRGRKSLSQATPNPLSLLSQPENKNPRINQLSSRWQQVWLLALERQRKLNDSLDRLEELKEFANFDFDVWRKKYMRWMNHKKSRVMDFFRRIDKDQDGKITRQEFIDGILASKFPTSKLEMTAVADIFDQDGDGYIDYYEFVAALHPNKDAYRPTTDADKIEDEVTRQVAQCKCAKRFQVEQIGENKYRFFLGNQFGDSQQLRLVRILRSTVMVRVGGGWMALDEFLVKNDPCRVTATPGYFIKAARGRTNLELREKFILPEGASQGMAAFRSRGRRSKPSSRAASPTRSSSSASHSNHSCTSVPSSPATPASGSKTPQHASRSYDKPWLTNSKASTSLRGLDHPDYPTPSIQVTPSQGSKLKRPTYHSSRGSLTGDNGNYASPTSFSAKSGRTDSKKTATSRPTSRAGSRTGSRASSRRGSDASDFDLLETQSACSDVSETSAPGSQAGSRRGSTKPSKIPTMSKKTTTTSPKTPTSKR